MCEPIAFQGTFGGDREPDSTSLRVPIGEGLTGWVAEHNQTIRLGDAGDRPARPSRPRPRASPSRCSSCR